MSGSQATNNQAVQFEEQQAAQAAQKDAERQQRLTQGQQLIDQIFNGQPVMASQTKNYDWSTFKQPTTAGAAYGATSQPSGTPAGYTAVMVPAKGGTTGGAGAILPGGGAHPGGYGGGGMVWALKDASGKIYYQGQPLTYTTQVDTGKRTGGFDDAFYQGYNQKVLDYYNPQENKNYAEAQRNTLYNMANQGLINSSAAADAYGNLAYNDALNKAAIVANANQQTGDLKNQILSNKQAMINELYSTEDPTLTANLAASSAAASRLQTPTLTPNAAFLAPLAAGGLSAVGAYGSPAINYNSPYGVSYPNQPFMSGQGGTPASASGAGSGRVYSGQ